jgi:putative endonuclease
VTWQVYIIRCSDRSLYTGITNDLERRWQQHAGRRGAKYFRARAPVEIVYLEAGHDRGSASRREADIKKLRRPDKERLIRSGRNELLPGGAGEVRGVNKKAG